MNLTEQRIRDEYYDNYEEQKKFYLEETATYFLNITDVEITDEDKEWLKPLIVEEIKNKYWNDFITYEWIHCESLLITNFSVNKDECENEFYSWLARDKDKKVANALFDFIDSKLKDKPKSSKERTRIKHSEFW